MSDYQPVIGLEIHVELSTKSKMFCQCSADYFGKEPNTHTCPVCLGLPGALPVPNKKAIEWALLIGKALHCAINKVSKFDRKHYFYPDLPKGYQISQYDEPFATGGSLTVHSSQFTEKKIRIRRVHLEEDTGKLLHSGNDTLVDFNRSGVPLVEIVTEPDFTNSEDVKRFGEELQAIVRALKVSDADMEKGSMRLEPNISVGVVSSDPKTGERTSPLPPYKVEVKNINSFNFAKRAIDYEVQRHSELLEKGETPAQETRGYNEAKGITVGQRSKEEAHDYRYFPEPDIPPFEFNDEYLHKVFATMPELPEQKRQRYEKDEVSSSNAYILSHNIKASIAYEILRKHLSAHHSSNFIVNKKIDYESLNQEELVKKAGEIIASHETDVTALVGAIDAVIKNNGKVVNDYKSGKQNAFNALIGEVMKEMKGKADATIVREELLKKL